MPGERVQRYELVEQIGLGGMAEVFRARQIDEDGKATDVVIKKILPHLSRDPQYRAMFIDEARIASTLRHPNIVQLLELGDMDGHLFLALEFVDGADGKALLFRAAEQGTSLTPAEALFIAREVLKGLHYAHIRVDAQGVPMQIVHRDVSPQNVFLSRRGEAKLGDFGIATAATRGGKTVVGVVKGNPLYMAPEQVRGGSLDARTDVYAAGLLLMALLCGHHPAEEEPLPALLNRALNAQVPRPSQVNRALPESIDLLVSRATMLDPAHRYQTAQEFAQAIDAWVSNAGLRLDAKPIATAIETLFPARLPVGEEALPPVMVGTIESEGAPFIVETVSVLDRSDPGIPAPTRTPARPSRTPPGGEPGLGAMLGAPRARTSDAQPPPWEAARGKRPPTAPWEKAGAVPNLAPPATKKSAAASSATPARRADPAFGEDGDDEADRTEEERIPESEPAGAAPSGESGDALESLLLREEGRLNADRTNAQIPSAAVIAAANRKAAAASGDAGDVRPDLGWEEVEKTEAVKIPPKKGPDRTMVSLAPATAPAPASLSEETLFGDGVLDDEADEKPDAFDSFAPSGADEPEHEPTATTKIPPSSERASASDGESDGERESLSESDEPIEPTALTEIPLAAPASPLTASPFADMNEERTMVSIGGLPPAPAAAPLGDASSFVPPWPSPNAPAPRPAALAPPPPMFAPPPPAAFTPPPPVSAPPPPVFTPAPLPPFVPPTPGAAPAFNPFGSALPFGPPQAPASIVVDSAPAQMISEPLATLTGHRQAVAGVTARGKSGIAVSGGHDKLLRLWNLVKQTQVGELRGHTAAVTSCAMTPDGTLAVSGSRDKKVILWDLATRESIRTLEGHTGWVFAVDLSEDGRVAVSGSQDRNIQVWDLTGLGAPAILEGHRDAVAAVALYDDGRKLVSGGYDRTVRVWTLAQRAEVRRFDCEDAVRAVAVSPDGKFALSGGADSRLSLWNLFSGDRVRIFTGHTEPVVSLCFSADGRFAISGAYDGAARLWNVQKGTCLGVLVGHLDPVMSVAFSDGAAKAITASSDGTVRLWATGLDSGAR